MDEQEALTMLREHGTRHAVQAAYMAASDSEKATILAELILQLEKKKVLKRGNVIGIISGTQNEE